MRDDFRRLAHAGLTFNAPLSEERAGELVAALPISPGHHVLDLGCGWGELLLRILAAHPATTGTGVDSRPEAPTGSSRLARNAGCTEGESSRPMQRRSSDHADVVLNVAASHALGGTTMRCTRSAEWVAAGGRVLYGDSFWAE